MKLTALVLAALLSAAVAEDKKPAEPAKPSEPAKPAESAKPADPAKPAEATEPKVYAATDLVALKTAKGQKVILEGTIASTGASKGEAVRYLNFTKDFKQSASLVFPANAGKGEFTKEKIGALVGKKVRVTGTLTERNGALQITMEALDQIKVQE